MKVVLADYGAGNLRSRHARRSPAPAPRRRSRPTPRRSARRRSPSSPGSATSRAPRGGSPRTASTRRSASASRPGGPCSASASACSSSSSESDEGGSGLGLLAGPVRRAPGAARCRTWAGTTLAVDAAVGARRRPRRGGRLLRPQLRRRARRTTRRRRRRRPRRPRSSPPSSAARVAGVQFHPERSARCRRAPPRERAGMVKKRVIPCLDVADGRVVKGVNFVDLREMGEPIELATRYSELGADELVFLDITATLEGRGPILELIERAAEELTIPFTVGGGVTGLEDARVAPPRRRRQGRGQPRRVRRPVDPHRARRRVRLAGGRLRDRREGRRGRHPRRQEPARPRRRRVGARGGASAAPASCS